MDYLEKLTLKNLLTKSVDLYGDRPALCFVDGAETTYKFLGEQVQEISDFLHNQGIGAGDRVAILSENQPNWGAAYFAIAAIGAVVVPILPDFHSNEVHHILRHSAAKALFVSTRLYEKVEDGDFYDEVKTVILIDDFSLVPPEIPRDRLKELIKKGSIEFEKLKEIARRLTGKAQGNPRENDTAVIIYTSGTTGRSKGVMLSHKNIVFDAIAGLKIQDITPKDRLISILPLSHSYEGTLGFVMPIMRGATIYYLRKPPTARVLLPAMQKVKPTMVLTVPLIIEKIYRTKILPKFQQNALLRGLYKIPLIRKRLNRAAGKKLMESFGGNLSFFGIGGALLAPDVERFLREAKFPYAIGYGLTETAPMIAGSSPENTRYRSTGPPLSDIEMKIDKPDPKSGEGEIFVRGANVMQGYYNDPESTAEVLTEDGWFRTGDLGMLDKDNYLFIKGRLKNMILGPSGENIYPEEIEAKINECAHVVESLVFQQDAKLVARVHLDYESLDKLFKDQNLTESQIHKRVMELLEGIRKGVNALVSSFSRINRMIEQLEPFEKTPTKKIKRYLYSADVHDV
ncbi:MAG: long-chain fatty acid--CoA ligase [Candidatus Cloacimonetes bacterium 4572_55]|nr:MAG: long-chain fatty acid--CoA ligase [Candidatus Cloacimonetes bacterium 4572_55]